MSTSKSHLFSPIVNDEKMLPAIDYIADHVQKLASEVLGQELPIDTICFFTHSPEEYAYLESAVRSHGPESDYSHGATLYVKSDFKVHDHHIKIFGVRKPDPSRPQVGYGDFPVNDYKKYLQMAASNRFMKEIKSGLGKSLIELRHPDFDVLGFIVAEEEH